MHDVAGMRGGHCEGVVSVQVAQLSGVTTVEINAATGQLTVTTQDPVDEAAVLAAMRTAGYQATRSSQTQPEATPADSNTAGGCGCCNQPQTRTRNNTPTGASQACASSAHRVALTITRHKRLVLTHCPWTSIEICRALNSGLPASACRTRQGV